MIKENHEAALRLINEIALIDSDFAAKIKPSIDTFVESIDTSMSSNDIFNELSDFFKLTDPDEKKKWFLSHPDIADKVNKLFDSMNNEPTPITEATDAGVVDAPIEPAKDSGKEEIKIPEDGFKDERLPFPLPMRYDNKKFFGKTQKEMAAKKELDPNKVPKVDDVSEVSSVKVPNLKNDPGQINLESKRALYKRHLV